MADYLIQDTTLDAIANAINAKTGHTAPMTPVEMVSEIQSIPTGGGGSLPSVISKIDGGTFTYASDSSATNNPIIHSLGEKPKGYIVWSDYVMQNNTGFATDCLMFSYGIGLPWNNNGNMNTVGYSYYMYRRPAGSVSERNSGELELNSSQIILNVNANFHGGSTYKWLAWA